MSTTQIAIDTVSAITDKQVAFIKKLVAEVEPKIEGKTSASAKNAKIYLKAVRERLQEGTMSKRNGSSAIETLLKLNGINYEAHEAEEIQRSTRVAAPIGVYQSEGEIYRVVKARQSERTYAQKLVVIEGREPRWEMASGMVWNLKPEQLISPEVAAQMGRARGFCVICGRYLTDETSVARGIGPVCYERTSFNYANHPINN